MLSHEHQLRSLAKQVDAAYHRFYGSAPTLNIDDHIYIKKDAHSPALAETLLFENGDTLHISVRISSDLAHYFAENLCPSIKLTSSNLGLLAIIAEEISHFQCMCRAAESELSVSRFDLELQSEFDKFLIAAEFLEHQVGHHHPVQLARLLFDSSAIYHNQELYDRANNIAASWWWSQINYYGNGLFEVRPDLISKLKELRHIHGDAKLACLSGLKPDNFRRSA